MKLTKNKTKDFLKAINKMKIPKTKLMVKVIKFKTKRRVQFTNKSKKNKLNWIMRTKRYPAVDKENAKCVPIRMPRHPSFKVSTCKDRMQQIP